MELLQMHAKLVKRIDTTDAIRAAFADHPRHRFIPDLVWPEPYGPPLSRGEDPEGWAAYVYGDDPVITQVNEGAEGRMNMPSSSSSAPQLVADMIQAAGVEPGMRVLEIGTGTGWNAAVLSSLVGPGGSVTTVEIDPGIAQRARESLAGIRVTAVHGSGTSTAGSYDAVIATCSVHEVPAEWIEKARMGATVVVPWALYRSEGPTPIVALRKTGPSTAKGTMTCDASFMRNRTQPLAKKRFPGMDAEDVAVGGFPLGSTELLDRDLLTRLALTCPHTRVVVGVRPWEGTPTPVIALESGQDWAYIWPDGSTSEGGERSVVRGFTEAYDLLDRNGWPDLTEFSLEVGALAGVNRISTYFGTWDHPV